MPDSTAKYAAEIALQAIHDAGYELFTREEILSLKATMDGAAACIASLTGQPEPDIAKPEWDPQDPSLGHRRA